MITNKREWVLLWTLTATVAIVVGSLALGWYGKYLAGERKLLAQKEAFLMESRRWEAEENVWLSRRDWLATHPILPHTGQQGEAKFVQELQASLSAAGITIAEQRIQESRIDPQIVEASVDLVLTSSLEQIIRWLHEVQRPAMYRLITHLRIKSDAKDSNVRTEISLVQLFGTEGPSAQAAGTK